MRRLGCLPTYRGSLGRSCKSQWHFSTHLELKCLDCRTSGSRELLGCSWHALRSIARCNISTLRESYSTAHLVYVLGRLAGLVGLAQVVRKCHAHGRLYVRLERGTADRAALQVAIGNQSR